MATLRKFVAGALLLYAGFMLIFLGFMISGTSNPILENMISRLIPLDGGTAFRASIFQLLGGLVGVTGFILCISPTKPTPLPPPSPPTIIIQKVPEPAKPTAEGPKCRFCGSPLQMGEVFCPSCHRSQT